MNLTHLHNDDINVLDKTNIGIGPKFLAAKKQL